MRLLLVALLAVACGGGPETCDVVAACPGAVSTGVTTMPDGAPGIACRACDAWQVSPTVRLGPVDVSLYLHPPAGASCAGEAQFYASWRTAWCPPPVCGGGPC